MKHFTQVDEEKVVEDASAVYAVLAEQLDVRGPFLFGGRPSSLDTTIFAHLLYHSNAPVCSRLRMELQKYGRLTDYVQRMHRAVYAQPTMAIPLGTAQNSRSSTENFKPGQSKESGGVRSIKQVRYKRRGQAWIGFAALFVIGYAFLSGSYIELNQELYVDSEDDDT